MSTESDKIISAVRSREAMIRRIARQRLRGQVRAVYDSDDLVSSVARRLISMQKRGVLRMDSEGEVTRLVQLMAQRITINRNQLLAALKQLGDEDQEVAEIVTRHVRKADSPLEVTDTILAMLASLRTQEERDVLGLIMHGYSTRAAGQHLGMNPNTSKATWTRVKKHIHERFNPK